MAAPTGIVWGSVVNSRYRLGIYTAVASTNTPTSATVTIEVWLWSKWTLSDNSNKYYFDNNAISASTLSKQNITLSHPTDDDWSTSNQTKLATHTYTYTRTTSKKTVNCAAKLANIGTYGDTVTASSSYNIPALPSYTVSYVGNGSGYAGLPAKQVKWHGIDLTLSNTKPTRSGYSFLGWNTNSAATTATYAAGAKFTANANTNLYAIWKANTYTVSYNMNGGTGTISNQTKTHGVALTLSTTKPTRTDYNFLGWATSASATTATYSPGASYTKNAGVTLYAVWSLAYIKPRINNLTLTRCTANGTSSESGTYFKAKFSWATDKTVTSVKIYWKKSTASSWTSSTVTATGTSGSVDSTYGAGAISSESTYDVKVEVIDSGGTTAVTRTLSGTAYLIDFKKGGGGVAIGKPAESAGLQVAWDTTIDGALTVGGDTVEARSFRTKAQNVPEDIADDVPSYWASRRNSAYSYNAAGHLTDQPSQWGQVFSVSNGYYVAQLWLMATGLFYRGGSTGDNTWTRSWTKLLDANNYSTFALPLTGGTTTGFVKLGNTVNTVGMFRMNSQWMGIYPSCADAQTPSNRKGWIGYGDSGNNFSINNASGGTNNTNIAWTVSSDKRLKMDIKDTPNVFVDIWKELRPKMFKWDNKNSTNDDYHFGLIAQDVIAAFEKYGLDYKEYGFVNSFTLPDDDTEYFGIAYDEYHVLTSLVVKKQQERIDSLEERINKLEKLILGQEE